MIPNMYKIAGWWFKTLQPSVFFCVISIILFFVSYIAYIFSFLQPPLTIARWNAANCFARGCSRRVNAGPFHLRVCGWGGGVMILFIAIGANWHACGIHLFLKVLSVPVSPVDFAETTLTSWESVPPAGHCSLPALCKRYMFIFAGGKSVQFH